MTIEDEKEDTPSTPKEEEDIKPGAGAEVAKEGSLTPRQLQVLEAARAVAEDGKVSLYRLATHLREEGSAFASVARISQVVASIRRKGRWPYVSSWDLPKEDPATPAAARPVSLPVRPTVPPPPQVQPVPPNVELRALIDCYNLLTPLDRDARRRVVDYLWQLFVFRH